MKKLLLFFVIGFFVSACTKSDDNNNTSNTPNTPAATNTELITAKPWRYVAWTVNPPVKDDNNNLISDIHNNKPACDQDDLIIFNVNGNVDFDQGPTKCDQNAPQTSQNVWFFQANETKLSMAGRVYNVETLTDSELKLVFEDIVGSTIHIHTVTFNH